MTAQAIRESEDAAASVSDHFSGRRSYGLSDCSVRRSCSPSRSSSTSSFDNRHQRSRERTSYSNRGASEDRDNEYSQTTPESSRGVCAICLGRHRWRELSRCDSSTLWNGKAARCFRNSTGRIIDPHGAVVCINFQRVRGCSGRGHLHECSGCGNSEHGAYECPLAQ
ncbi:hypothetical protein B0H21DRAFT_793808, partial [Amylocystis lapponica]